MQVNHVASRTRSSEFSACKWTRTVPVKQSQDLKHLLNMVTATRPPSLRSFKEVIPIRRVLCTQTVLIVTTIVTGRTALTRLAPSPPWAPVWDDDMQEVPRGHELRTQHKELKPTRIAGRSFLDSQKFTITYTLTPRYNRFSPNIYVLPPSFKPNPNDKCYLGFSL